MPGQAGLVELSAGSVLRLDGTEWAVAAVEAQYGRVLLKAGGDERWRSIRWLVHHPDCQPVPDDDDVAAAARPAGQPPALEDLTGYQREVVLMRVAHLLEAETGFRGGDPLRPGPGEPRPLYDPSRTTLGQRRRAKAAELRSLGADEAALLGLGQVSERTLKRMAAAWRDRGPAGCIDRRWLRAGGGHPVITEELREVIFAVREETKRRSKTGMQDKCVLIAQYAAEMFGPQVQVPSYWTLREVWLEWFGPGGARPRNARAADGIEAAGVPVTVHRPGQVVALDTTPLPVKVRDGVFGEPATAYLTLALDLFTHSAVAFRLTLVSDTSVDIAMLLRDVMMPLPMRDGWGPEMEWPYPGVPASVVAEFAGHRVAGLPFFTPETVTTDHGSVYKNHALVDAQRALGCNILPARTLRPQDKAAVERAFGALRSLLFEHLPGYAGIDVAGRGADPEADAVLTMAQMEHLVAEWIVRVWQNRALGEHAPAWGPGEEHSPNTLFAAAMNQGGFALQVPRPELYYELLPAHHVKVHAARGVKIGGLWYGKSDPAIEPYQGKRSDRGGQHKGKWVIRSDRRDRRQVFFQDPADPAEWHVLRWNGLPPEGEVPAFSDKTAEELLGEARARGLSPRSDAELLPVLLELLGGLGSGRAVAHPDGQEGEEGPRPRGRPGKAGSQRPARQPARRGRAGGRRRGEGGPLAPAGAGPGRRRPRRRAPASARAGRPASACRARVPGRPAAPHQPADAPRGGRAMTAGAPEPGQAPARPAFFLPGPVPDRTTWRGWNQWRLTRRDFVPAPVITAQEHAQMTKRQQRLHDLHRVSTHSNLEIQETPMSAYVSRRLRSLVETNAFCQGPETRPGLMVNGGGCQGKTETVCEALACFEDEWLALYDQNPSAVAGTLDQHAPVAYVRTPVKATPISACQRILDFYGEPYKGMRQEDLIRTVKNAVYDHGTKALAIDDITRLKMHREADQDVLDLIRELMSLPVTLILVGVGIPKSGLLRDGRKDRRTGQWLFPPVKDRGKSRNDDAPGQTDLRFDLIDLGRFSYSTPAGIAAWTAHLVGVEQQLRLLNGCDGMLSGGDMPEYLFGRTRGIVGLLKKLIQEGCRHAIETGAETISADLLEDLVISPEDLPGLDPDAGEVPDIPVAPATASRKPRKGRNTVFDDRGVPAGTAG